MSTVEPQQTGLRDAKTGDLVDSKRDLGAAPPEKHLQSSQPSYPPAPPMSTASQGPLNPNSLPRDEQGKREWSRGLYSDMCSKACCLGFWLPCILHSDTKKRYDTLHESNKVREEENKGWKTGCIHFCADFWLGAGCILTANLRGDLRDRYRISGTDTKDLVASCLCTPCAMTQIHKELEAEELYRVTNGLNGVGASQQQHVEGDMA